MRAQLRAELFRQRSVGASYALFAALLGLVLLAALLHGLGLPAESIDSTSEQLTRVFGWGARLGSLFAGLLGAMAITSEFRHGTIRPTFLVEPRRGRVLAAKVWISMLLGAAFGLAAGAVSIGAASAALGLREIPVALDGGDFALLLAGGVGAAALWAAIGVGLGAVIRNQVVTLVAISTWLLLIETLLIVEDADFAKVGRFGPGAAAAALTGLDPEKLLAPGAGFGVLVCYAALAWAAGALATSRRDVV